MIDPLTSVSEPPTDSPRDPAGLSSRRRALVLAAMCLALVMVVSGVSMLNNALPHMAESLGLSQSRQQWVVDAYTVALAALLLPAGAIGDRFGRRGAMIGGILLYGAGMVWAALAGGANTLIAARVVAGLGAAFIMPGTLSTITSVFPPEGRARAVGIWAGFAGAGGTIGLLLSGVLVDHFYWGSVFVVSALLSVVALLAVVFLVPSTRATERIRLDPAGAVLAAVGIGALVLAIIEGPDRGWSNALTVSAIVTGVVFVAAFIGWELRNRYAMLDPRLFRHRGMATGSAAIFLMFLAMFGFFFIGVQYLQLLHGYGALKAGLALFPMSVVFVVVSPIAATLSQRLGQRLVSAAGLFIAAGGFALFLSVTASSTFWLFLATSLVLGLGIALAMTPATNAIVASLPPAKQGVASAINDLSRELGSAFGVAIIGSAFNTGYRNSIDQHVSGLAGEVAARAHEAPATAYEAAAKLPRAGAEALVAHTNAAFVNGLHSAILISGVAMLLGAVYVALRAPTRAEERAEDVLDQRDADADAGELDLVDHDDPIDGDPTVATVGPTVDPVTV
jgi:EmrB/QacA subfamily drug resistance transporter